MTSRHYSAFYALFLLIQQLILSSSPFIIAPRKRVNKKILFSSESSNVISSDKEEVVEQLSLLTKESFYCLRTPDTSTCTVECKRTDGKPLGSGGVVDDDLNRRAFAFTSAPPMTPNEAYAGPRLIHIREIPFYYGKLGGSVWYAAVAFAQYLALHPSLIHQKRILELGAGVGLPGLLCAKAGAKAVTLSEYGLDGEVNGPILEETNKDEKRLIPVALLDNLRYNVMMNSLEDKVTVRHLDWYDYTHPFPSPVNQEEDEYDLIIGSDLVNWEEDVGPLIATLQYFLECGKKNHAKAIISLSAENRKALPSFLERIEKEFGSVEIAQQSVVHFDEHPLVLITLSL